MITIIGNILDSSGYSRHTRELANALNKITEVSLQTSLTTGWERQVNDAELEMIKRETDNEINLIITNPLFWRINCTAKKNMCYLVWEGSLVPEWMLEECCNDNINKIIVPSDHTRQAIVNTISEHGLKYNFKEILDKVVTIPHGVDLDKFHPIPTNKSDTFKFLAVKGFTNMEDRGGIQFLIESYLKEFSSKDNTELILKINAAYGIPDFNKLFPNLKNKNNPKITLITETLDDKQLNELYNSCDVFVSPTRAESFNLPCLEALACGKPVITTNYGGQTDFCDKTTGWLVSYKLTEVTWDLMYEGIKWATPDIDSLRLQMRRAFIHVRNSDGFPDNCLERAKQFTWDATAKYINQLIN